MILSGQVCFRSTGNSCCWLLITKLCKYHGEQLNMPISCVCCVLVWPWFFTWIGGEVDKAGHEDTTLHFDLFY